LGVRVPAEAGNFSLLHRVQTGSGTHPASYPRGTRGSFPGVKQPRREADHSLPSSVKVKNAWSYTSTPPVCLHGVVLSYGKQRDNFTFTFCLLSKLLISDVTLKSAYSKSRKKVPHI
jgi:hypothetical protein